MKRTSRLFVAPLVAGCVLSPVMMAAPAFAQVSSVEAASAVEAERHRYGEGRRVGFGQGYSAGYEAGWQDAKDDCVMEPIIRSGPVTTLHNPPLDEYTEGYQHGFAAGYALGRSVGYDAGLREFCGH